jgi:uncharacterized 2Fe-2S/4Fe-4S cluster protein (DUF4445 family)
MPRLKLSPAGRQLDVRAGAQLQDLLFAHGVEFPCGGHGRCKGCRVKLLRGDLPVSESEATQLTAAELTAGWRLACRHQMTADLELELAQWELSVLTDQTSFAFTPGTGLGVAIDLGTTTLAAQLVDLATGNVLGVQTSLNPQARHGGDVMSRIEFALRGGRPELTQLIRSQLGEMLRQLLGDGHSAPQLNRVVIVGNTVMHHLFCGLNVACLAEHPFQTDQPGRFQFSPRVLDWHLPETVSVEFLPCLGGFVGSDILAGIVATGLHQCSELTALMDLGTNGEVVMGRHGKIVCTSTAAGPAFEGARISQGMRACTGAISNVHINHGALVCRVIGGGPARGLCGSGLVDAVAAGLELGWIQPSGRMTVGPAMALTKHVSLQPGDVRELQLAKGAIAAGLRLLASHFGASREDVKQLHLAGAFGNYISRAGARQIGLLNLSPERIVLAGNTALLGAKMALFDGAAKWDDLARKVGHLALNELEAFQDIYAEEIRFPKAEQLC